MFKAALALSGTLAAPLGAADYTAVLDEASTTYLAGLLGDKDWTYAIVYGPCRGEVVKLSRPLGAVTPVRRALEGTLGQPAPAGSQVSYEPTRQGVLDGLDTQRISGRIERGVYSRAPRKVWSGALRASTVNDLLVYSPGEANTLTLAGNGVTVDGQTISYDLQLAAVGGAEILDHFVIGSIADPLGCGCQPAPPLPDFSVYRVTDTGSTRATMDNYLRSVRG